MIHNIVVVDGQEYKAVKETKPFSCKKCIGDGSSKLCRPLGESCYYTDRADSENVIYKPHYKLKQK